MNRTFAANVKIARAGVAHHRGTRGGAVSDRHRARRRPLRARHDDTSRTMRAHASANRDDARAISLARVADE
ncbi:hypothetical protein [Cupriavidus plantarum]|uniref:hypothetical protein n=1 Tax=Cupriavidus plantarum TaxID=942865 RepID=UPI000E253AF3|nr:hypothetical protein [Cupriavidus plantarum]NYH99011.1 hypothetical protein [Cupriavidus plantarum]